MLIRVGYELVYDCPQPTPMMLMLNVHSSRIEDVVVADQMVSEPAVPITTYRDGFDNRCSRLVAPAGRIRLTANGVVRDSGEREKVVLTDPQHLITDLPDDVLVYLLGSRYCETDRLSEIAWSLFQNTPPSAARVQAICDWVNGHITFDYQNARSTRTAYEAFNERVGVCRDFAHLAVAFCRAMNIPARYCTGYLGDIGEPPPYALMDFAAWFEAYVGGRWQVFDPRNNQPRIGRVLMARGRDAADVALSNTFGPNTLVSFKVWTDEVIEGAPQMAAPPRQLAGVH